MYHKFPNIEKHKNKQEDKKTQCNTVNETLTKHGKHKQKEQESGSQIPIVHSNRCSWEIPIKSQAWGGYWSTGMRRASVLRTVFWYWILEEIPDRHSQIGKEEFIINHLGDSGKRRNASKSGRWTYIPWDTRAQKRRQYQSRGNTRSTVHTWEVSIMFSGPQDTRAEKGRQAKGSRVWNGVEVNGKFQLWSPGPRIRERTCTNLQPTPDCFVSNHNLVQTGTLLQ